MRKISAVLAVLAVLALAAPKAMCQASTANSSAGAVVHLQGTSNAPTAAIGAGAGAGPDAAATLTGTDLAFQLTVAADGSPTGSNAVVATVTFATPYATAPYAVFSPANNAAAALTGATSCYVTTTPTQLVLHSGASALSDDVTYAFNFLLSQ